MMWRGEKQKETFSETGTRIPRSTTKVTRSGFSLRMHGMSLPGSQSPAAATLYRRGSIYLCSVLAIFYDTHGA